MMMEARVEAGYKLGGDDSNPGERQVWQWRCGKNTGFGLQFEDRVNRICLDVHCEMKSRANMALRSSF